MNKSTLPWSIKQLKAMYDVKHTLSLNHPIQRRSGQWSEISKMKLIHSILANYYIPPIFLIKESTNQVDEKGKALYTYSVLDGKQRLGNIFDFIDNKYAIHESMPIVTRDGMEFELGGLTFDGISEKYGEAGEDLQQDIRRFIFTVCNLEDATDDELEEQFERLNNGVALSANDISRSRMGSQKVLVINEILEHSFFSVCSFSAAQLRRSDDLGTVLQTMMIMDKEYDYKSIAANEAKEYATEMKNAFNEELHERLVKSVSYLDEVFKNETGKNKWCKKINIPMLIVMAEKATERNIEPLKFREWFDDFFSKYTPMCDYAHYCSTGSIKKEKTEGRLRVMGESFDKYFEE